MNELTTQQQLVLDQKYQHLDISMQAGDHLDSKASTLIQAGGFIIALTAFAIIPSGSRTPTAWWFILGVGLAFCAFVGMIVASINAWKPSDFLTPGKAEDFKILYDNYIDQRVSRCYEQIVVDTVYAIKKSKERNDIKGKWVRWSARLLAIQVIGILLLAVAQNQVFVHKVQELFGTISQMY